MCQICRITIKIIYNISLLKNKLVNTGPSQTPHNLKCKILFNIINIIQNTPNYNKRGKPIG